MLLSISIPGKLHVRLGREGDDGDASDDGVDRGVAERLRAVVVSRIRYLYGGEAKRCEILGPVISSMSLPHRGLGLVCYSP